MGTTLKTFLFIFIAFFSIGVSAEYRVYQYYVKSKLPRLDDPKSYLVTSTLDPVSYLAYHGGSEAIKIDLIRSWMCKGYTGGKKEYCQAPLETAMNTSTKEES